RLSGGLSPGSGLGTESHIPGKQRASHRSLRRMGRGRPERGALSEIFIASCPVFFHCDLLPEAGNRDLGPIRTGPPPGSVNGGRNLTQGRGVKGRKNENPPIESADETADKGSRSAVFFCRNQKITQKG